MNFPVHVVTPFLYGLAPYYRLQEGRHMCRASAARIRDLRKSG